MVDVRHLVACGARSYLFWENEAELMTREELETILSGLWKGQAKRSALQIFEFFEMQWWNGAVFYLHVGMSPKRGWHIKDVFAVGNGADTQLIKKRLLLNYPQETDCLAQQSNYHNKWKEAKPMQTLQTILRTRKFCPLEKAYPLWNAQIFGAKKGLRYISLPWIEVRDGAVAAKVFAVQLTPRALNACQVRPDLVAELDISTLQILSLSKHEDNTSEWPHNVRDVSRQEKDVSAAGYDYLNRLFDEIRFGYLIMGNVNKELYEQYAETARGFIPMPFNQYFGATPR